MAFWYAKDKMEPGEMFGSKDGWQGKGSFRVRGGREGGREGDKGREIGLKLL